MLENGRYLGALAALPRMRPCGVLRFVQEQARDKTLSRNKAPHHSVDRTRRELDVVFCG